MMHKYYEWSDHPSMKFLRQQKGFMIVDVTFPTSKRIDWGRKFAGGTADPKEWPEKCIFKGTNEVRWWDCMVTVMAPKIVSERAKTIFEKLAPDEMTFFPISIKASDGETRSGYYLVAFPNALACIDRDKTVHTVDRDDNSIVLPHWDCEIVLNRSRIGDRKVFVLSEHFVTTVIRDDIKKAIEDNGLTGFNFGKPLTTQFPDEVYKPPKRLAEYIERVRAKQDALKKEMKKEMGKETKKHKDKS